MSEKALSKSGREIKVGDRVFYIRQHNGVKRSTVVTRVNKKDHFDKYFRVWGLWTGGIPDKYHAEGWVFSETVEHVDIIDEEYEELLI